MKKILIALLALVASGHAAPVLSKAIQGNIGQSIPLFGAQPNTVPKMGAVVNLDTSEVDTSYSFYELIAKPVLSIVDTIGFVHFAAKDSVGTDSLGVRLIWWGNSRSDGLGIWSKIDSVSILGASASSYVAATPTPVINSKGYQALMFTLANIKNSAVGLKAAVKDVVLNRPKRGHVHE